MPNFPAAIPLSLYIHIPWCIKKCPYCDFNSHALQQPIPEDAYIEQLIKDLEYDLAKVDGRSLTSIFIGGGTPSLLSPPALKKILIEVKSRIDCPQDMEITLEANPGTVEQQRFVGFVEAGINRLSIGCQSFNDAKLKTLGRIHGADEAIKAITAAKTAGFNNFNIDLMFGLPNQTIDEALADLTTAISLQPTHLSWYQLTLEPNTLFYQKPPVLPDDEHIWDMQLQGQHLLQQNGYEQYEVSAYSQIGKQCIHNRNYWEFGDYLGIGAGAHSKLTDITSGIITRAQKFKHPKDYLQATDNFCSEINIINKTALPFEFMLNALRLYAPIPLSLFAERTGLTIETIAKPLQQAHELGLLKAIDPIELSIDGKRFLNNLVELFI